MIELQNISFAYPGEPPLMQGLSCHLRRGRLTVLLGPNGCGKSTLLRLAAGLLRPSAGEVLLGGRPISQYKPREAAKQVALLGQLNNRTELTVRQLAEMGRYPYRVWGRLRAEDKLRVDMALEQAGIARCAERRISTLSGGQLQRAYIALALAQDAAAVLLDEPTAWLDISARFEIMGLLLQLCAEGRTIAVVMHELDLALEFADELMLLDGGRLQVTGSPADLAADGSLERLFGIRVQAGTAEGRRFWAFAPAERQ